MRHKSDVVGAQLFANEQRVLTWSWDGTARVWEVSTGQSVGEPMYHERVVLGAQLFSDEQQVLTWSADNTARVWEVNTGKAVGEPMRHENRVVGAQLFAQEQRVLTWSEDKTARVWDTTTGKPLSATMDHDSGVTGAKIFADEAQVLAWSRESVRVWRLPSINHQLSYLNEIQQTLQNRYYINSADEAIFLTENQLSQCQTLYQPYQACNESDSNICKLKRRWWSIQKFFGQLPTLADCIQ